MIGFIGRFLAHDNTDRLLPFILQNSFILLAPALFAASIYIVLGRIIRRVKGEPYSLVPARWLTRMFVSGDVLSFAVQGSAAGLMATGDNAQLGENIVVAGLFIQIVVFGFFVVTAGVFQVRMQRRPTVEAEDPASLWREDLGMLYTASGLIMVRSIFRVVEFIMGYDGYLLRHEWTLYVFDAVLMLLVMVVFLLRYPGRAINPDLKSGFMCLREL